MTIMPAAAGSDDGETGPVPRGDLVCAPCGVVLMRGTAGALRASRAHETIVLCPCCGTKLRWR